mmetsp:Transcript_77158/g.223965  ORF Transcript_77158/g.223965 Transcript_77158/m.223965 type:complete len:215 (+) Transcript_77158:778-1422(+)
MASLGRLPGLASCNTSAWLRGVSSPSTSPRSGCRSQNSRHLFSAPAKASSHSLSATALPPLCNCSWGPARPFCTPSIARRESSSALARRFRLGRNPGMSSGLFDTSVWRTASTASTVAASAKGRRATRQRLACAAEVLEASMAARAACRAGTCCASARWRKSVASRETARSVRAACETRIRSRSAASSSSKARWDSSKAFLCEAVSFSGPSWMS